MKFDDVVLGRRSIRGYLNKPVPKALIREVIELAMRAPTSLNTQPWNFYVVGGAVLDRIEAEILRGIAEAVPVFGDADYQVVANAGARFAALTP